MISILDSISDKSMALKITKLFMNVKTFSSNFCHFYHNKMEAASNLNLWQFSDKISLLAPSAVIWKEDQEHSSTCERWRCT